MESTSDQAAEGKAVVTVLAAVLERLVKSNANATKGREETSVAEVTKFHALKAPGISIKLYLERIHKYASCSTECFVLALIYIDRLIQKNNFILSDLNVHRVVITAILLAAKFFDDAYYNNAYYAKVGGVLVSEMNSLEVEFLFRINFSLHVKPEVFEKYQDELVSHAVGAGFESQHQLPQPQQIHEPKVHSRPNLAQQQGLCNVVPSSQAHQQQPQVPCPPIFQPTQSIIPQTQPLYQPQNPVVGNVTPSPPPSQQMEYSQQQQKPPQQHNTHRTQSTFFVPNQLQSQAQQIQTQPYIQQNQHQSQHRQQSMNFEEYVSQQHGLYQQQQQHQQQQYPIISSNGYSQQLTPKSKQNQILSSTKDVIFATCCPYGGRLTPSTSATGFINTAARVYQ